MTTRPSVLVAGGGIGGLAAGIALRRSGLDVTVVERSLEQPSGSGLVLAPNGMKALAALGDDVAADVRAAGVVSGAVGGTGHRSVFLSRTGQVLSGVSFDGTEEVWGAPIVSLRRADLHGVLLRHARRDGVRLVTGAGVSGYRDDGRVTLDLPDGGPLSGDVLVGADGLRSAVRAQLLADGPPRFRGYSAVRGLGPVPAAHPDGFIAYGRGLILFASPVGGGRVYWVASVNAAEGEWPAKDAATAHRDLLALLQGWHPDLRGVVAGSDPADQLVTDIFDRDPVDTWSRGRVALLGDAAHPMVYTLGQGANVTLEDAVVLAAHLAGEATPEEALAAYGRERAPRAAAVVRQSRLLGTIGQVANPLAAWARDRMMTAMGRFGDPAKQNAALFGWAPPVSSGVRPG